MSTDDTEVCHVCGREEREPFTPAAFSMLRDCLRCERPTCSTCGDDDLGARTPVRVCAVCESKAAGRFALRWIVPGPGVCPWVRATRYSQIASWATREEALAALDELPAYLEDVTRIEEVPR